MRDSEDRNKWCRMTLGTKESTIRSQLTIAIRHLSKAKIFQMNMK